MPSPSRVSSSAAWIGLVAAAAFGIGPALSVTGLVAGFVGFRIYTFGLLLGLIGLLVGLAGLWHTRASAGRAGRARALTGVGIGLILAVGVGISLGSAGRLPAINDITTNPADPPQFSHAGQLEPNRERDLAYPGPEFAAQQRAAYPDLEPLRLNAARNAIFEDSLAAAADLGWEITYRDADQGLIEATDTTAIFRFVDDVIIRIRPSGKITVVDVRSKSRDGQGDLGVNAERIRAFRESLTE